MDRNSNVFSSLSTYGAGGTRVVDLNGSFTGSSNDIAGFRLGTLLNPSANITNAYGSRIEPTFTPANLTTVAYVVTQRISGATGSTTGAITSYQNLLIQTSYGTIKPTTAYGAYIDNHGSASITNSYGLYVAAQSGSTNAYSAIFAGGNVGIGTTTPAAKLEIAHDGSSTYGTAIQLKTISGTDGPRLALEMYNAGTPKRWNVGIRNSATAFGIFEDGYHGAFGTERVTVLAGGNVGIGTTNPGAKLDVAGTLRLNGTTAGTNYTEIKSAATPASNITYTLPAAAPAAGQYLQSSDATGTLAWSTVTVPSTVNFARTFF